MHRKITPAAGFAALFALLTAALPMAAQAGTEVPYSVGGTEFRGYLATPEGASRGTVLIVHDWDGLNDYERARADKLASEGFAAFAVDLFGTAAVLNGPQDYRRETGALYGDRDTFRARLSGALEAANAQTPDAPGRIIMGYCFGGAAVLEAARAGLPLDGFVSFHGGLGTPDGQSYAQTPAPVLVLHGSADPVSGMIELATLLDELQTAGVAHQAEVYGGARHSFTVPGSRDYDATADAKSWDALMRFLDERL